MNFMSLVPNCYEAFQPPQRFLGGFQCRAAMVQFVRVTNALILQTAKRGSHRLFDLPLLMYAVCLCKEVQGWESAWPTVKTSSSYGESSRKFGMCLFQPAKTGLGWNDVLPKIIINRICSQFLEGFYKKCPQILSGNGDENLSYSQPITHFDHRLRRTQPGSLQRKWVLRPAAPEWVCN